MIGGDSIATTKFWAVHEHLGRVVFYVMNPKKTVNPDYEDAGYDDLEAVLNGKTEPKVEQVLYVTGINVDPLTAAISMRETHKLSSRGSILAYHGEQSFAPGEVTPEVAHEIGVKLAQRLWGDRFEVVVATHLDQEHLHNHFVVNAVSFIDGKRYRYGKAALRQIRRVSDELCREYSLSVIEHPKKGGGKPYAEWLAEKEKRPTIRGCIKKDINSAVAQAGSMEEFFRIMNKKGYRFRLTGKHPAIFMPGAERWMRLYKLGSEYELEAIARRIRERRSLPQKYRQKQAYRNHRYRISIGKLFFPGIRAYYYRLLYDVGVLPNKRARKFYHRPKEDRRVVYRLDRYSEELRLLSRYHISTITELQSLEKELKKQKEEQDPENAKKLQREMRVCKRIRDRFDKERKKGGLEL